MATAGHDRPRFSPRKQTWHLTFVYNDPEFVDEVQFIDDAIKHSAPAGLIQEKRRRLARNYHISLEQLGRYEISRLLPITTYERTAMLDWDGRSRTAALKFDVLETSEAELIEEFKSIRQLREIWGVKVPKRSNTRYGDLLYAIFKSLQQGKTFPEIHANYVSRTLPGYTKSPSLTFGTAKLLRDYYQKFAP